MSTDKCVVCKKDFPRTKGKPVTCPECRETYYYRYWHSSRYGTRHHSAETRNTWEEPTEEERRLMGIRPPKVGFVVCLGPKCDGETDVFLSPDVKNVRICPRCREYMGKGPINQQMIFGVRYHEKRKGEGNRA